MCRFLKEVLDYSEAENEMGWKEKNRCLCSLKTESNGKKSLEEETCCRFAENKNFTECPDYRAV